MIWGWKEHPAAARVDVDAARLAADARRGTAPLPGRVHGRDERRGRPAPRRRSPARARQRHGAVAREPRRRVPARAPRVRAPDDGHRRREPSPHLQPRGADRVRARRTASRAQRRSPSDAASADRAGAHRSAARRRPWAKRSRSRRARSRRRSQRAARQAPRAHTRRPDPTNQHRWLPNASRRERGCARRRRADGHALQPSRPPRDEDRRRPLRATGLSSQRDALGLRV